MLGYGFPAENDFEPPKFPGPLRNKISCLLTPICGHHGVQATLEACVKVFHVVCAKMFWERLLIDQRKRARDGGFMLIGLCDRTYDQSMDMFVWL